MAPAGTNTTTSNPSDPPTCGRRNEYAMRLFIASLSLLCATSLALAEPLLTAYHTDAAPTLDGDLSDVCWQAASVASHFLSAQEPGLPNEQTQVRVCWDETNIYLGVEAFDSFLEPKLNMMHLVKADQQGRDAQLFSDDCIEVFLQPPGEASYHFAANSGTGSYEARDQDAEWDCAWQCVAKRGPKSYVLEMAIPFAALAAQPEGAWRVNFARERTAVKELSTWCGLQGAFYQPETFGTLSFAETGPALSEVSLQRQDRGFQFRAVIGGAANDLSAFQAVIKAGEESKSAAAHGAGPHSLQVELPDGALETGQAEVSYALQQGKRVLLRSAPIPQALGAAIAQLSLRARDAEAKAFLNGTPLEVGTEPIALELGGGLNVLALEASATGEAPTLSPHIAVGDRPVALVWQCKTETPAEGWREQLPREGWVPARSDEGGIWTPDKSKQAYFACGLYVAERRPQLFPKLDTFYLPRGSQQLMRFYVHAPMEVPSEKYRMVVEVPAPLKYIAVEPVSGGDPQVTLTGTFQDGETQMARYAVAYESIPRPGMELSMRWGNEAGTTLMYMPTLRAGGTCDWRHMSMVLTPPPGAVSAHPLIIKWQNRGITGTFWVDNLVFREKDSQENLLKMGTFDEPEWGGHWILKPEGPDGSRCCKIVSTPQNANKQQALWVDKEDVVPVEQGKEYVIELDVKCENLGSPSAKPLCGLLFEAPEEMDEGELPVYTYFEALGGALTELPQRSRVVILPPLKNVRPKRARLCPCYYSSRFKSDEVGRAYAENCWASGITWTYGKAANNVVPHLLPRGHRVILSIGWDPWSPPSSMRGFIEEHPELQAVDFQGKRISHTFCPTWMLAEGDEVIEALGEWLLETVNGEPYFGANWDLEQPVVDPPTFCTCDRCQAAFRKFANLPEDAPLDPDTILKDYREQWTDFRCAQNAEMAGRIKEILSKADRPIEFSVYSGYQSQRTKEHYGVDWALMAPHLDFGIAGYGGDRTRIYDTVGALGDVPFMGGEMWYLSHNDDARPAPRMETWRNRVLRQYVESGCKGVLFWQLASMDGGAFYATSEAAEIIAKYEDYFKLSQRCDDKVEVTGVEPPNWAAFEKDGEVLVLLMNFKAETLEATVQVAGKAYEREIEPYGVDVLLVE